ncbi:glucose-1-phosphate cytidylyltransferase [Brevibacillus formosus]|uniref:Glucose-1-phosphate cytidylyltransferase n=1 Tax=Brevibacillus formosus TaxID=54913 RepID=A0A837KNA5_9BACL|nr:MULTISPECIES: glucose-1-phosphate cytidylyltransferase [Brevibacillus]KLH98663.1 glucose-1-phosphate cytidylyltransferase [Brevibacillus formosus]MED1946091.1 glucose-1-phosphate cytidylyltransferase [Brevibacillus formosus]MED1957987.1 glucose-1-phosphate cytidylyltransferase [Brevibacillus formosus]MED1998987.1 glucose-1-phosphate cytidylyltransferase [Brevibacillus formosus]MED2083956.1 glucose-1-phosphate cytidylyltransferase [Brevibacillus formosus]
MKVVILAGGYGTRIGEETHLRPKPLIEIGDWPIICHIMSVYSKYGFHDFIICLGYKGYMIKEYFAHYFLHHSDVTFDFRNDNQVTFHNHNAAPWRVTLIDTGKDTGTGGRVRRIQKYVGEETFMLTYGDGLSDIDIEQLVKFHRAHKKLATITTTQPPGRFGALDLANGNTVTGFQEKPKGDGGWINAGFFVMEPGVFDYIAGDETVLEKEPLESLAKANQLMAFKHTGFWHPMDTLRDKNYLEELWKSGKAAWATSRT